MNRNFRGNKHNIKNTSHNKWARTTKLKQHYHYIKKEPHASTIGRGMNINRTIWSSAMKEDPPPTRANQRNSSMRSVGRANPNRIPTRFNYKLENLLKPTSPHTHSRTTVRKPMNEGVKYWSGTRPWPEKYETLSEIAWERVEKRGAGLILVLNIMQ